MKGDAFFAFYGDGMSWLGKGILGVFAVGAGFALWNGDQDNPDVILDDLESKGELGTRGGFATVKGAVRGLGKEALQTLEENGVDVSAYTDEDGYVDVQGIIKDLEDKGLSFEGIAGGNPHGIYVPGDGEPLFGRPPEHDPN